MTFIKDQYTYKAEKYMDNIFDKQSFITNESDLDQAIRNIADGDIPAYCNLKDFFLFRFPLFSMSIKNKYMQYTFETMKQLADKNANGFAKAFTGWMLWTGIGTTRDDELAKIYINNSATDHNTIGLVELGLLHLVGHIDGKPNRYIALNLFEEAMHDNLNGYAALMLGVLNAMDANKSKNSILFLQNGHTLKIPSAAVELANSYRGIGKLKEAYQLYSMNSNNPISLFQLGILHNGIDPDKISIDYIKSFQCFLAAQASGHPYASFYIAQFIHGNSSDLSTLCSKIEKQFNDSIKDYQASKFEKIKTIQDIFNEMKVEFKALEDLSITQSMLKLKMTLDEYVNFCYCQCVLSSNFISNLQISIEEYNFQYIIEHGYNKIMLNEH